MKSAVEKILERENVRCYQDVLDAFSDEELGKIVQLKRFFEWAKGDPEFRSRLADGRFTEKQLDRMRRIGINLDLSDLAFIWEDEDSFNEVIGFFSAVYRKGEPGVELREKLARYPLLNLWIRYNQLYAVKYSSFVTRAMSRSGSSKLDAWRKRRIESTKSELGLYGYQIDHPVFALELSHGCSVGCWFCAFAVTKLDGTLVFDEKKDFFRGVVREMVESFGPSAAGEALLYYRTEPHDNRDYIRFMEEFGRITGSDVCTSTAATGDAAWIRSLIDYYRRKRLPWPRLSVLSKAALYFIHDNFSPEDLRDVELLMQMKDTEREKVHGGRILVEQGGLKCRSEGEYLADIVPQGSIACISGFLVDMVRRTIEMISPCYTSNRWPFGYRIFGQASFSEEPGGFTRAVTGLIEKAAFDSPPADKPLRFRDDLAFKEVSDGFDLVSPNQVHHYRGGSFYRKAGALIAEGKHTYEDAYALLAELEDSNPMGIVSFIQDLFDDGRIDEVYLS